MKPVNFTRILLKFQRQYPPPMPRFQEVNYGTDKKPDIRGEFNYASPEYISQKQSYDLFQAEYFNQPSLNINALVESIILSETEQAEVTAWINENGNQDNLTNKQIFFEEILCIDQEDMNAIKEATSPPAPHEVRAVSEYFQD
jgi:aspartyl-tRNA synthetase